MKNTWQQNTNAKTDEWDLTIPGTTTLGHISNYDKTDDYFWRVTRNDLRLCGSERGREASMAKVEEMIDLPIDDFKSLIAGKLLEKMRELEQELLLVRPESDYLPGYKSGYEAGIAELKSKIEAVM